MLGDIVHLARNLRAGFVLAREGALALVDPSVLPPPARLGLRLARLIERPDAGSGAAATLGGADPARTVLRQGRPVSGDPPRHRRGQSARGIWRACRTACRRSRARRRCGRSRRRSESRSTTLFLDFSEPVAAASIAQVHQARIQTPEGEETVAVKVVRPGVRERFARDLQAMRFAARWAERSVPTAAAPAPGGRGDAGPVGRDRDGPAA